MALFKKNNQPENSEIQAETTENQAEITEKQPKEKKERFTSFKTRSFRVGGYSVAATAMVLAIIIVINLLASALPSSWTKFDMTSSQLYTISEQTESILANLTEDVQLYWVCQSGNEDTTLEALLDNYEDLSKHIKVEKKDPNVNPTFIQQYVTSGIYNNSVIVVCGDRYRYVEYYDIYEYDTTNYYYDGTYTVSFAGEGALTSAISYVTNEDLPKIYTLTGHGESSISSTFTTAIEKENMEVAELSLLTVDAVPEDADCVIIYIPQSDISAEEKEMLLTYMQNGGNLYYISQPAEEEGQFANLEALLAEYGLSAEEGVVVEGDQSNYFIQGPIYLLPTIKYHEITSPLQEGGYYVMLPAAHGINVDSELRDGLTVDSLLTTSNSAFSKIAGYGLTTLEKEEGDIDGPFNIAVAATDENSDSHIVWVSSAYLCDDTVNQQVSGGNQDFFINALGWMCDYEDSISIHSKSLDYDYLTIDNGTASTLTIIVVAVIPVLYLAAGIYITIRRRRR